MNVWLLAIDRNYSSYEELKIRNEVAQGWSALGDLSALLPDNDQKAPRDKSKFRDIIYKMVDYVYGGWDDPRDPGRVILNLVSIKDGDYVICCEGETIRGIAKVAQNSSYKFRDPYQFDYAHAMGPVSEWQEIVSDDHGIKIASMGPVGINYYHGDVDIPALFEKYKKITNE